MTWPWVIWFLLILVSFALLEAYAFRHPERTWTLSRTVAWLGHRWPLSIGLIGGVCGGLLVHFFWPFCPQF